jgi:hypothetical protein
MAAPAEDQQVLLAEHLRIATAAHATRRDVVPVKTISGATDGTGMTHSVSL